MPIFAKFKLLFSNPLTAISIVITYGTMLAGCTTAPASLEQIGNGVQVHDTQFDTVRTYLGPEIDKRTETHPAEKTPTTITHRLYADQDKKSGISNIYLHAKLTWMDRFGWRRYDSASFEGGHTVRTVQFTNMESACGPGTVCFYEERIAIPLKGEFLQETVDTGFSVRLNSRAGKTHILKVSHKDIVGFFTALREDKEKRQKPL